ncbi:MAG: hypothetical protein D3926_14320 [Desulfobacteraceae bacterium]|nr:MAG: hypothetical protein D3926_14320 [Desulfobacteraceae bacterium]
MIPRLKTDDPLSMDRPEPSRDGTFDLTHLQNVLQIDSGSTERFLESLPFSFRDVTAGCENEFQAVVLGKKENLDLAITIEESNYYKNQVRRAASGDTSRKQVISLDKYLNEKKDNIWENSWVRFPQSALSTYARHIFNSDLKSDKTHPDSGQRSDAQRFFVTHNGEPFIRIPVSYLLKLALADTIGSSGRIHPYIRITGEKMMSHFLNDNTSPEVFSFHPVRSGSSAGIGRKIAHETSIRFLMTQLLATYAENRFKLKAHGQEVRIFFSASPPLMQKRLNDCISDSFYRDLFMSPCLSGWARGEEKYEYMKLCHKVLSRSQINAISKLKEAGIINSNLVVLPNSSNTSLANNGTHISIGSHKLGQLIKNGVSGFSPAHEKYLGDLVIKIVEHFVCLFPGTFSASPYRLNFEDFHPERVLSFLPHEIDYTHLRMIWRRWKRKAKISILGQPLTPFGPVWLDRLISKAFFLKGDMVPDFRLVDYLVSLMSTDQSPSLDGSLDNDTRLGTDLSQMGVFDDRMPLYQLVRLRKFNQMGYSGFEHRYYSIFHNLRTDMAGAADLQTLLTALAFQYVLSGRLDHTMIPDTPDIESERRQIFFCAATDLPTFYVKTNTRNQFLSQIVCQIPSSKIRQSRRYPGYTRIRTIDFKMALISMIKTDGRDLIDSFKMRGVIADLESRIQSPGMFSTSGVLTRNIMETQNRKNPLKIDGETFNRAAERYYIDTLRHHQIKEGFDILISEFKNMELWANFRDPALKEAIQKVIKEQDLITFTQQARDEYLEQRISNRDLRRIMFLIILFTHRNAKHFENL